MSSHENCAGENQHEIRSKNDNKRAYLMFKNRSRDRRVAIYWKNYKGERVRYHVLEYGHTFSVNTYETHPWVFADADTGDRLVGNGCMHYMPTAWAGEPQRTVVQICLPVYRLEERCLQVVKAVYRNSIIAEEDLPRNLLQRLHQDRNVPFLQYNQNNEQE